MDIQICVGSSCHLRGSQQIVELLQEAIKKDQLENEIILSGCFCTGQCNRVGVAVQVNGETVTGVTPESFGEFYSGTVMKALEKERKGL